jgi:predicted molibdopterin-dependent oxidoreductase YjgC
VQRFYPAVPGIGEGRPDWQITAALGVRLGQGFDLVSAAEVMDAIRAGVPGYEKVTYPALAQVEEQWPAVGGLDLYFGGTSYANRQGLGVGLASGVESGQPLEPGVIGDVTPPSGTGLLLIPVERLYDRGTTVLPSEPLGPRLPALRLALSPADSARLGIGTGQMVEIRWDGRTEQLPADVTDGLPEGAALVARSMGLSLTEPVRVEIRPAR